MLKLQTFVAFGVALLGAVSGSNGATTVVVNGTASHSIPPLLCAYLLWILKKKYINMLVIDGLMYEVGHLYWDASFSIDSLVFRKSRILM